MTQEDEKLFEAIQNALANDQLRLPSPPDVVWELDELLSRDDTDLTDIAEAVGRDPAIASRLLRIANNATYAHLSPVATLTQAIGRIGMFASRQIVAGLAVGQLFHSSRPVLNQWLLRSWRRSVDVAATARMLAANTRLDPQQALVAGLVHEIGVLPILKFVERQTGWVDDADSLERTIWKLHPRIGNMVLSAWRFPPQLVDVPLMAYAWDRQHPGRADYGDIAAAAVAMIVAGSEPHPLAQIDPARMPAFEKLGINPNSDIESFDLAEVCESAQSDWA